jgi:hypothetical protein
MFRGESRNTINPASGSATGDLQPDGSLVGIVTLSGLIGSAIPHPLTAIVGINAGRIRDHPGGDDIFTYAYKSTVILQCIEELRRVPQEAPEQSLLFPLGRNSVTPR